MSVGTIFSLLRNADDTHTGLSPESSRSICVGDVLSEWIITDYWAQKLSSPMHALMTGYLERCFTPSMAW